MACTATYCRLCEAQCGMIAHVRAAGSNGLSLIATIPVSEGHVCIKGTSFAAVTYDPDRVLDSVEAHRRPRRIRARLVGRSAGRHRRAPASDHRAQHGGEAIGSYKGNPASFATLHSTYGALFLKALGGFKNFNAVQIDTGAKNLAQELVFGSGTDWTFADIERCDFLIMIGANPLVSHMSLIAEPRFLRTLDRIAASGGVVVIDPRRTETARRYEHLAVMPDSDAWLVGAMIHHIFAKGLEARAVLEERTTGWEQLREALAANDARNLQSSAAAFRLRPDPQALAERFAATPRAACYGRVGTNRGRFGTLVNLLIESLNVIAGKFGVAGRLDDGPRAHRQGGRLTPCPCPLRQRALAHRQPADGARLDAGRFAGGGNHHARRRADARPVRGFGQSCYGLSGWRTLSAALEELELLVGIDFYVNETTRHAHYVLPSLTFLEREDLTDYWVRNAPRPWVQFSPAVIEPVGESRHEFDIYNAILARMGLPALFSDPEARSNEAPALMDVADRMLRVGPFGDQLGDKPDGLTIARLRRRAPIRHTHRRPFRRCRKLATRLDRRWQGAALARGHTRRDRPTAGRTGGASGR
jgi:anaerobic selenocysteine-containing dehydrogenase